jgi:hypothetical protein
MSLVWLISVRGGRPGANPQLLFVYIKVHNTSRAQLYTHTVIWHRPHYHLPVPDVGVRGQVCILPLPKRC